jgi:hypothetical protein
VDLQAAKALRSGVSADRRIFGLFKRRRSTETPLRFHSLTGMFFFAKNRFTSPTV